MNEENEQLLLTNEQSYEEYVIGTVPPSPRYPKDLDCFLSHASWVKDLSKESIKPLPGEFDFVDGLYKKLMSQHSKKVWVNFIDNPSMDHNETMLALKRSKYGIFICSQRYINRYRLSSSPEIREEKKHFWTLKEKHHLPCVMPILFGVSEYEMDSDGPFSTSDFRINAEYGKLSIEEMIEKVAIEVVDYITHNVIL